MIVTKDVARVAVVAVASIVAAPSVGYAVDPTLIEFSSAPVPMSVFQQRIARERGETNLYFPGDKLQGYFRKPDGDGPFHGAVFLSGNLGLDGASKTILPEALTRAGFVTLVVDSTTTRPGSNFGISPLDAYGALIYLSHLSYVETARIALIGTSAGGDAALSIAQPGAQEPFYNPDHLQFHAAVAFTPRCNSEAAFAIPTLVLAAELDQRAPPSGCARLIERHATDAAHPTMVVYPGVHNGFQVPEFSPGRVVQEYWREYNAVAAARATEELTAFLHANFDK